MEAKKNNRFANMQVCTRLVQRDLLIFFRGAFQRRLINAGLWTLMVVYIFEYVGFSGATGWGLFIACSECADHGFSAVFNFVTRLVGDIKGPRTITYYLTLPIPQYQVFLSIIASTVIQLGVVAFPLLPLAKFALGDRFDLSRVSYSKTVIIFFCSYLFYGSLVLFYTSFIKDLDQFNNVYVRVRETLFWVGATFFTWNQLYEKSHVLAYLDLLNPLVYACEGLRGAIMGQEGSLPVWWCCLALLGFALVTGYVGMRRMMKQLDCL